jgi:uncharacterized membrane protein
MAKSKKSKIKIKNANKAYRDQLSRLDRFAVWITEKVGTMGFFLIIFTWTVSWLSWNIFAPSNLRFDPFPGFVFWLFISNMIQIFLMPLIMIGQNLQGRHAEIRTESDYEVNLKNEKKVEEIYKKLEAQDKILNDIIKKLDARN